VSGFPETHVSLEDSHIPFLNTSERYEHIRTGEQFRGLYSTSWHRRIKIWVLFRWC